MTYKQAVMGPMPADRRVSFFAALFLAFGNFFKFEGRSSRGAYWWYVAWLFLIGALTQSLDAIVFPYLALAEPGIRPVFSVWTLLTFFPSLGMGVRRLHDIGKSGWWLLLILTGIGIVLIIYWAAQPGHREENLYGPDVEAGR
ncbi:MAG: DUF805 domain-containing protein [Alphaproteobacteria bacterium]|nr:DUF805 domain-containing protein [Alphaproteobacteria bacterium]